MVLPPLSGRSMVRSSTVKRRGQSASVKLKSPVDILGLSRLSCPFIFPLLALAHRLCGRRLSDGSEAAAATVLVTQKSQEHGESQ